MLFVVSILEIQQFCAPLRKKIAHTSHAYILLEVAKIVQIFNSDWFSTIQDTTFELKDTNYSFPFSFLKVQVQSESDIPP